MIRFRRYRIFLVGAAFFVFLLFRLSENSRFDAADTSAYHGYSPAANAPDAEFGSSRTSSSHEGFDGSEDGGSVDTGADANADGAADVDAAVVEVGDSSEPVALTGEPASVLEDAGPGPAASKQQQPPSPYSVTSASASPSPSSIPAIHWTKQPEHFPLPEESIIPLPTGAPKPMPRIQHLFEPESETESSRAVREQRLAFVRSEMQHAWAGYRAYAWTHDEVTPVSKSFRDPFCGWAATLVDALDTLWIMRMYGEFDEAYAAVQQIDFTTTPYRDEIPVFETIIRYLGGLIAAYDLTGGPDGQYPALLTKAVELADILMSIFDTPNRMPILYYNWKPAFASQRHTASDAASIAELGSMTMEFTRLAQLTGQNKYYDAIARIVDALEEWQNRPYGAPAVPGLFPERLDASGCNRTKAALDAFENASKLAQAQAEAEAAAAAGTGSDEDGPTGYKPVQPPSDELVRAVTVKQANTLATDAESGVQAASDQTDKVAVSSSSNNKRSLDADVSPGALEKREDTEAPSAEGSKASDGAPSEAAQPPPRSPPPRTSRTDPPKFPLPGSAPIKANGQPAEFRCIPQSLTSSNDGRDWFSMGGSQDSTYEYFQKQYLLLGGLVPKYLTMHEKTVDAVKKYLLYRPMIKDNTRDILFSAKVNSRDGTDKDLAYTYEVSHLTCFLGGMMAMGGRVFDRPEDVVLGAKITEGCVWAYEAMPLGVMPEWAHALPCTGTDLTDNGCAWNETAWYETLDPNWGWRERQMQDYETRLAEWKLLAEEALQQEQQALEQEAQEHEREGQTGGDREPANSSPAPASAESAPEPAGASDGNAADGNTANAKHKRGMEMDGDGDSEPAGGSSTDATAAVNEKTEAPASEPAPNDGGAGTAAVEAAAQPNEDAVNNNNDKNDNNNNDNDRPPAPVTQKPLVKPVVPPMPVRPTTHEEYVQSKIERERLVPGFVSLNDRKYILRPEALESVWYMYRITGDAAWQDKGWRMFEAVVNATRTAVGHSAVADVTVAPAAPASEEEGGGEEEEGSGNGNLADSMESFWVAETLKYAYLLFAPPDVISLDDYVLNTEAHPFRRPT